MQFIFVSPCPNLTKKHCYHISEFLRKVHWKNNASMHGKSASQSLHWIWEKKEFEENWTFWPFRSTQRPKRSKSNLHTCPGLQMSKVICVNFFWTQILPCTYTDVIIVFLSCSNLWPTFVDPTCSKISWESWRKRKLRVCQPAADGTSWCGTAPLELLH